MTYAAVAAVRGDSAERDNELPVYYRKTKTDESAAFFADKRTDHRETPLWFLWMVLHDDAQTNNY